MIHINSIYFCKLLCLENSKEAKIPNLTFSLIKTPPLSSKSQTRPHATKTAFEVIIIDLETFHV